MKVFLDLMWFFKQEKKAYLIGILTLLFVAFLQLIPPKIIGSFVDQISSSTMTGKRLLILVGILILAAILMYVLRYYWRVMIFGSSLKLAKQLRKELFKQFTNMPQSFYQKNVLET